MSERILGFDSIFNEDWIRIEKKNIYRLINNNHDYCKIGYITKDRTGTVAIIDRDMPIAPTPDSKGRSTLTDKKLFSSSIVKESNQYYYEISSRCYLLIGYESDRRLHISRPALVHFDPYEDDLNDDLEKYVDEEFDDENGYEDDDED